MMPIVALQQKFSWSCPPVPSIAPLNDRNVSWRCDVLCIGCKIKALRAKTNTYIKTPARGDEPIFVITGRREDVNAAKQEILSAADHFSQIRASRRVAASGSCSSASARSPTSAPTAATSGGGAAGHVTCEVRVPVRSVGLVVGPKGSTVKRIQQLTQTYIVTPSRGTEPVFEVVGSPDNVERARREIESRVQQQRGAAATIRSSGPSSTVDLPLPSTTSPGVVGCWTNPATSSTLSSSLGFPDVIISGDEFRRSSAGFAAAPLQSDPLPLVDVWNRGGLRSAETVPRGFTDLLSSLGGGVGGLGLLNDPASLASTFDGDEGIGSLSPDPLGFEGSPWSRTTAGLTAALSTESTSVSGRRSWIDVDLSATSGVGLEVGGGSRLGAVVDWSVSSGNGGTLRYTDSSSDSPTDCISVTPPRSPMACLFG